MHKQPAIITLLLMVLLNITDCYNAEPPIREEVVPTTPAKPQLELFATVSRAIRDATGLPNPVAALAAGYRGYFVRPELRKAWTTTLPAHYLDALVKPLSDGRIVALAQNGEFMIVDGRRGTTRIGRPPQLDKINCIEVLPDDTILTGSEDGSIYGINVESDRISCPFAFALTSRSSVHGIAYVQPDKGEEELAVATNDSFFTIDRNTWKVTKFWPIKNAKSLTRLSNSTIGFTYIYNSDSAQQKPMVYHANFNKQGSLSIGGLTIPMLNSNGPLMAQCGEKIALAHAGESTTVSFCEMLDDGCKVTGSHLSEGHFDLHAQDPEHPATITSLGDAIAVNDNGTVHIVDGDAQLLQTLPDGNIDNIFSDGKNGLVTIRRGEGLLRKRTAMIAAWKPVSFEQQEDEHRHKKRKISAGIAE